MNCGVKYCEECNPRINVGKVFAEVKEKVGEDVKFTIANKGEKYDCILEIGGGEKCCSRHNQYNYKEFYRLWNESQIDEIAQKLEKLQ